MLKYQLLHPEILQALGAAGHGAQVLIADGNYPFATRSHPSARRVYLNLAPELLNATDVLNVLADAELQPLGRFDFYDVARSPELAFVIATGERRVYANILLTIGVVPPA